MKQEQQIVTVYEKQKIIKADKINPLYLESIEFKTITIDNENYIVISTEDYEKLLLNIESIRQYIKKQKDVIDYYESEIN